MPARLHASCMLRLPGVPGRNDGFPDARITLSNESNRCASPTPLDFGPMSPRRVPCHLASGDA